MLQYSKPVVRQSSSNKGFFKLPVLYTHQVTRKKKTYSDGFLKVTVRQSQLHCSLVDAEDPREMILESRTLEYAESKKLLDKQDHLLTFDKYVIQVNFEEEERTVSKNNEVKANEPLSSQSAPLLKPKKFKVPSHYVPPSCDDSDNEEESNDDRKFPVSSRALANNASVRTQKTPAGNSKYLVDDDELDDIWNSNNNPSLKKKKRGYDDENIVNSSEEDYSRNNHPKKKGPSSGSTSHRHLEEASQSQSHSRLRRNNSLNCSDISPATKISRTQFETAENNNDIGLFAGFNLSSSIWNEKQ
jgi:hypothetical protein